MKSKATILGHSLHVTLVPIPLGAIPTALVFNVLTVALGPAPWGAAAFVATLVGTVGIALAVIPGLIDYLNVVPRRGEVWRHASVHMTLGFSLLGVFIVSSVLHWFLYAGPTPSLAWSSLGLTVLGSLGLVVQGYLGSGLVEDHQIGVNTEGAVVEPPASERFPVGDRVRRGTREG